jgi:CubicO group peptidase (beta-lactamase class C family)
MTRTRYDSCADVIKNRAQGYIVEDGALRNDVPIGMGPPGGAGGLLSTAKDLVRWQTALVSGKVVSPASFEEMTTPYMFEDGRETRYGMGLMSGEMADAPTIGHDGGIQGFTSTLRYFPDTQLSIAVLSNSEGFATDAVAQSIAGALLRK